MCVFCDEEQDEIFLNENGDWVLRVEGFGWDSWNDCREYTDLIISYCPYCGRELK